MKTYTEFINESLNPDKIKNYYVAICAAEKIKPIQLKFGPVKTTPGHGGAFTRYDSVTMTPELIQLDLSKLNDVESAILHEVAHQILLLQSKDAAVKHNAKFRKLENQLLDKYLYSEFSKILYK